MGTSVALALAAFCVMFVAGTRKIYLGGAFALAGTALYVLVQSNANRLERFLAWKDLDAHRLGAGLQQYRASIALSRGGWTGWAWETARKNTARFPLPTRTSFSRRWERNSVFTGPCSSCSAIS